MCVGGGGRREGDEKEVTCLTMLSMNDLLLPQPLSSASPPSWLMLTYWAVK